MPILNDYVTAAEALPEIEAVFSKAQSKLSLPVAQAIARDVCKRVAGDKFKGIIRQRIQDLLDTHIMMEGEPDPSWRTFQWATWAEPFEEQVSDLFDSDDEIKSITSLSFRVAVDAAAPRTHDEIERFCQRFADDAWRVLTAHNDKQNQDEYGTEKSPGQILSSVGIVTTDIESLIPAQPAPLEQPKGMQEVDEQQLISDIREGADMMGVLDDDKQFTDLVDNASDEDVGLSQSAFAALGVEWTADAHSQMQLWRMIMEVAGMVPMFRSEEPQTTGTANTAPQAAPIVPAAPEQVTAQPEAATATVAAVPPKTRAKRTPKPVVDQAPEIGLVPASVLETLKDKTGIKAEDLGAGVGASRTTFLNYVAGKAKLYASEASKAYMMGVIEDHIAALEMAKMELEAVEAAKS